VVVLTGLCPVSAGHDYDPVAWPDCYKPSSLQGAGLGVVDVFDERQSVAIQHV
jgi:hypothetical protein